MARRAALLVVLAGAAARAEDAPRVDHRGALGLLLGAGIDFQSEVKSGGTRDEGRRLPIEALVTLPIGPSGNEWTLGARTGLGRTPVDVAVAGGVRGYFGEDVVKTYVTAELSVHVTPNVTAGPRLGLGVQFDVLPTLGLYLGGAAEVAAGQGIRISGSVLGGLQLRTYVFE